MEREEFSPVRGSGKEDDHGRKKREQVSEQKYAGHASGLRPEACPDIHTHHRSEELENDEQAEGKADGVTDGSRACAALRPDQKYEETFSKQEQEKGFRSRVIVKDGPVHDKRRQGGEIE